MNATQAERIIARLDAQMDEGKRLRPAQQRQYDQALSVWTATRNGTPARNATPPRTTSLMDHLQEQGYEPDVTGLGQYGARETYELIVSGTGSVRVCVYPDDGYRTDVYALDGYMGETWHAKFSPGTPDAAIIAVIEAAEWQLADKRGGPVTPAQAENAR